jgi:hypothetical protein
MNTTKDCISYLYIQTIFLYSKPHVVKKNQKKKITKTKDFTEINKLLKRLQTFSK